MSQTHKSTSPSAIQVKNWWKIITTAEKLDTISQPEKGEEIVDICHNAKLAHSSISEIRENAEGVTESVKPGTKVFV
jgi:selenophosphate synthetase-related protein